MPVMQITHGRNKAHVASIREDAAQFGNGLNYFQFSLPSKAMLRIVGKPTRFDIGDVPLDRDVGGSVVVLAREHTPSTITDFAGSRLRVQLARKDDTRFCRWSRW